jgi:pimeloyl-ACP methyl ester carboxylesterase
VSHARDQRAFRLLRGPLMDWRPDEQLRVPADTASVEARCWGPPPDRAPTLVLLHEGLGSAAIWGDFPARLVEATGFGVLAYSRPGYGGSAPCPLPRPLDFMEREATGVLPQVLDAAGFRRGVLLGHSDGATIAALHAGTVEDFRVRGVVLLAPHFFVEEITLRGIRALRDGWPGEIRRALARFHPDPDAAFRGPGRRGTGEARRSRQGRVTVCPGRESPRERAPHRCRHRRDRGPAPCRTVRRRPRRRHVRCDRLFLREI